MPDNKIINDRSGGRITLDLSEAEAKILKALRSLNYGLLEVTVHDSRIVQVQRTEKMRFSGESGS